MTARREPKDDPEVGLLMVLDAGGGGGRCLLLDTGGREVSYAYRPWTMRVPDEHPAGSVFDPDEWWSALVDAAREALAKVGGGGAEAGRAGGDVRARHRVLAISTTSIRDAAVFLDADGRELYCGTNHDGRAVGLGFEIAQTVGATQWRVTGRWPLGLDPAARLLWYKQSLPDVYARVRHVLSINTWITYRLSGEFTAEPTNASSFGLFDVDRGVWSAELEAAHGFDPAIFPPISWPGQVAGHLRAPVAATLGLEPGIPVVTGLADSQAGCLGAGAWVAGDTTVIAGTTAPVMQVTDSAFHDETHRIWAGAYAAPGKWVVESNAGLAGTVYAWYASTFVPVTAGRGPYEVLEDETLAAPPGQILAWLGPTVANFSSLSFPMEAVIKFPALGVVCTPSRGAMARAVLENIAYAVRGNIEQLPVRPELVRLCGGLARSRALARILAAVVKIRVAVPAVREATAIGAAIAAAVGAGVYPDIPTATGRMVSLAESYEPDATLADQYDGQYAVWRAGVGG